MTEEVAFEAEKVEASADVGVRISWADGHVSHWDLAAIRGACGCATCHELRYAGRPVYLGGADSLDVGDAELVGAYGITFHWSDGHSTGIYSWEDLRNGCPCDECRTARRVEGRANPLDRN
ncbi:MAG: DUF971 domain-containing protein [Actinomycetota bacterium]